MKITTASSRPFAISSSTAFIFLATCLALASGYAAAPPAGAKTEPKPYTLFMGADFDVQQNKDFYRVQDVDGGSFVIKVNGEQVLVPMDEAVGQPEDRTIAQAHRDFRLRCQSQGRAGLHARERPPQKMGIHGEHAERHR